MSVRNPIPLPGSRQEKSSSKACNLRVPKELLGERKAVKASGIWRRRNLLTQLFDMEQIFLAGRGVQASQF